MFPIVPLASLIFERGYTRGAEIGVWRGDSSNFILNLPGIENLYMVDAWQVYKRQGSPQEVLDTIYEQVKKRVEPFRDRAVIVRRLSTQAAQIVPKDLDFVFIDASHDYESVKEDIEAWRHHIRPGGVLAGDDYCLDPYPNDLETHLAVNEAFGDNVKFIASTGYMQTKHESTYSKAPDGTPIVCFYEKRFWYVEYEDLCKLPLPQCRSLNLS